MKTKKWLKIITDDGAGFSSQDIQAEIDSMATTLETSTQAMDKLTASLAHTKKQVFGGNGTQKDILTIEKEILSTRNSIESMTLVIDDLQAAMATTLGRERVDRLNRIQEKMDALAKEEGLLWKDFEDHYSRACALAQLINGRPPHGAMIGGFEHLYQHGTDRGISLRNKILKHVGEVTPIAEIKNRLRNEAEKLRA